MSTTPTRTIRVLRVVFPVVSAVFCLLATGYAFGQLQLRIESGRAQHGVHESGRVVTDTVRSKFVQVQGEPDPTTVLGLRLAPDRPGQPVGSTECHVPYADDGRIGTTLTVVLDPRHSGYAELPDTPMATTGGVTGRFLIAAFGGVFAVVSGRFLLSRRNRGRDTGVGTSR